jgi:hypothetical protein
MNKDDDDSLILKNCEQSGNDSNHHFAGAGKQISLEEAALQTFDDDLHFSLSVILLLKIGTQEKATKIHDADDVCFGLFKKLIICNLFIINNL